ncbi:MAG: prolipoprotein diacylglyceryl transferase family protein, partial [Bryobacteraceae bacterium]
MLPKLISFGSFYIPTYGLLVAIAFLVGLYVTQKCAVKIGLDPEKIANLAVYCALFGLLGAKIFMILFDWPQFAANPKEIFSLSTLQAAGVFQGGLILALVFAVVYMHRNGLPFLRTADAFAPGLTIGHA